MFRQFDRREFLGGTAGALAVTVLGRHLMPGKPALATLGDPATQSEPSHPEMLVYSRKFLTMEMPMALLTSWITPVSSFFVRNNMIMPASVDVSKWELRIAGEVQKPLTLSFGDLAALMKTKVTNTLECAGNGRAFYDPRLGGVQWRKGAVGNGVFEGPGLRELLRLTGLKPTAHHVAFSGLDSAPVGSERFIRSIPLEKALNEDTLIATHMNGAPLTLPHGFPARALVPGWIGSASIKWLQEITVLSHEYAGAYMNPGYRIPADQVADRAKRATAENGTVSLTSLRLKSVIAHPGENAVISLSAGRTVLIGGAAWAGEKPVASVECSTDGGGTWHEATLSADQARYAWRLWEYNWTPAGPGNYQLVSRAKDVDGNRQPLKTAWNAGGYLWNAMDRINVEVKS
jgi:DMSO/TMAO reductase YedYZ molybdopterin-dependent catalytic subunit